MSAVVERTKAVLQDGGKGRDDYSVLVSAPFWMLYPMVWCPKVTFWWIGVFLSDPK